MLSLQSGKYGSHQADAAHTVDDEHELPVFELPLGCNDPDCISTELMTHAATIADSCSLLCVVCP